MPTKPDEISFDVYHPHPILLVITGVSGVGKDTVLKEIKARKCPFHYLVTATTRAPRPGEVEGEDYIFMQQADFVHQLEVGGFVEFTMVYDQYKGIPRWQIEGALASRKDVVMRVNVDGALKVKQMYPDSTITVFLVPDSMEDWILRLKSRGSETDEQIAIRKTTAVREMEMMDAFDYVVVNPQDQLQQAVDSILAIVDAEHHRLSRRSVNE